jgi:hypothetical protein
MFSTEDKEILSDLHKEYMVLLNNIERDPNTVDMLSEIKIKAGLREPRSAMWFLTKLTDSSEILNQTIANNLSYMTINSIVSSIKDIPQCQELARVLNRIAQMSEKKYREFQQRISQVSRQMSQYRMQNPLSKHRALDQEYLGPGRKLPSNTKSRYPEESGDE